MSRDITGVQNIELIEPLPFHGSLNSQVYYYKEGQKVYKAKGSQREIDIMIAAGDCAVQPCERVIWRSGVSGDEDMMLFSFTMKRETPLQVAAVQTGRRAMFMDDMISVILALHAKGIIHGDVKPANMLLCSDGKIRLCDFAEARLPGESAADWEGETTANYLSPRRCKNSGWPDHRDPAPEVEDELYALGLSIWELYTGKMPFDDVYEDDIREMVSARQTVNVEEVQDETAKAYIYGYLRPGGAKI
jgi:hypothetical protein